MEMKVLFLNHFNSSHTDFQLRHTYLFIYFVHWQFSSINICAALLNKFWRYTIELFCAPDQLPTFPQQTVRQCPAYDLMCPKQVLKVGKRSHAHQNAQAPAAKHGSY